LSPPNARGPRESVCHHRRMQRAVRRAIAGLSLVVVALVVSAAPAAADPARPTNYRSEVTSIEPASAAAAMTVDVIGGDAFLRIRVRPGHDVVIRGYDDEPYVRVRADGVVEQNEWSNAVILNTERYGGGDGTPVERVGPDAEPRWVRVGDGGEFVWHDHRAHWMGKATPPQLGGAESGVVYEDWFVPVDVDGVRSEVHGTLVLDAAPSPWPWLGIAAVLAAALAAMLLRWRGDPVVALAAALAVATAAATAVSAVGQFGLPADAGRQHHHVIVPAIAFVAAAGALALRRTPSAVALVAGSALTAILWALIVFGVLTHAHAPTTVAEGLQRAVVSAVFGVAGACVAVGVAHELRTTASRTTP
jgi:hypothetical protein